VPTAYYMELIWKRVTGTSIIVKVNPDDEIVNTIQSIWDKRDEKIKNATIMNYAKSINLVCIGKTLLWDKKWKDYSYIVPHITIQEILKSWTMTSEFNFSTLSAECPITLEEMENPYMFNPGCGHTFDYGGLKKWIDKGKKICPICNRDIHPYHLNRINSIQIYV
jgi:Zinc-finger of the MIZ type in Nse subunit